MFHLLPEKEKKVLRREYYYRLAIVALCFLIGSLLIASVFLFPSYIISERKLADIKSQDNQIEQSIKQKTDPEMANFLSSLGVKLSALKVNNKVASSSVYLKEITDKKTDGVSLTQFSITNEDNETIFVSGIADTRDHLIRFSRDLQSISDFSKVDLPISDFAQDKNISFDLTITIKK